MTDAVWLASTDPEKMLVYLRPYATDRQLRLFACACCWQVANLLTDKARNAVAAGEEFVDGLIGARALHDAWVSVGYPKTDLKQRAAAAARCASASPSYPDGAHGIASHASSWVAGIAELRDPKRSRERAKTPGPGQCSLLHDIFGNPFRPVTFDPNWLTSMSVALAEQMYDSRDFSAMPILADALQDAGCESSDILDHCRGPGPHVRGCWVVDRVLGKS